MADNDKKSNFLVFLLQHKYDLTELSDKTYKDIIEELDIKKDIKNNLDLLLDQDSDKKLVLLNLEKIISDTESSLAYDMIFCIINSDTTILKIFKDKDFDIPNIRRIYEKTFKSNKGYLKSFNTKDKIKKESKRDIIDIPRVTRFCPEPSGCLHIGHVKALLVNYNMAINSKGKFLLRFDDTNPIKDYERYEKEILNDLKTLDISGFDISHSSDYFDYLVEKAYFLIENNLAYFDNTEQEIMRSERFDGIESKCRNNEISKNLEIFNKMLEGSISGYCLRAKIDMSNNNKTMRDPVIYRCSNSSHCRCDKYKAYPTYDFVCPLIDSLEGVTVVSRADEYKDRNEQYKWFLDKLNLSNKPELIDFSKLNFADTLLSKRKIEKLINEGYVTGWDDPRLATVQGIKRHGMSMKALKEYINLQGASNKTCIISWDKVWAMNKKVVDMESPRFMAVEKDNCVRVKITNLDVTGYKSLPLHKKNSLLGSKKVLFSNVLIISQDDAQLLVENEEFTLMHWGNAIVKDKTMKDGILVEMKILLHVEGDFKSTKNKISWISELGSVLIKTIEYGNILVGEDINPESKKTSYYYVESSIIENSKVDMHLQLERIGFFYLDRPFVFHLVPFTKQKRS